MLWLDAAARPITAYVLAEGDSGGYGVTATAPAASATSDDIIPLRKILKWGQGTFTNQQFIYIKIILKHLIQNNLTPHIDLGLKLAYDS